MDLNKCCYLGLFCYCGCYLSYFFIIYFLLFRLFIFGYGKLGLLDQGVHKLFEGVHNFYLRREYLYKKKKKKISFDFSKSQGV